MLAIQETARLFGYLNKSLQGASSCFGALAGIGSDSGATCKAQATERRASSRRPWDMSQWGDSGTQLRTIKVKKAGSRPIANRPRQPTSSEKNAAKAEANMTPSGMNTVTRPPMKPRMRAGTNSCTSGRSTQYSPPTPNPTKKRMTDR